MSVRIPLLFVLAVVAWLAVKYFRLRWWAVVALVLLGFYLAGTSLAPVIEDTTRSGVDAVNGSTK